MSSTDKSDLNLVYPDLYLSNMLTAANCQILKQAGITHIINLSGKPNACPSEFKYLQIMVDDLESADISQYFNETNLFILTALSENGKVLVHCAAGISRSPTIVLAYLIEHHNFTPNTALKHIRLTRPIADPNLGFMRQLGEYFASKSPI